MDKSMLIPLGALLIVLSGYISWALNKLMKISYPQNFISGLIVAVIGLILIAWCEEKLKMPKTLRARK
ncbi:hypothetical protein DRN86_04480 [Candidatus Geothermarchaeota archaeon]|nr:MAG: hypothetical protein DRN86_04480 [Candidatus Geothermarchaeota archaeon]